jgi:hypothetical protein
MFLGYINKFHSIWWNSKKNMAGDLTHLDYKKSSLDFLHYMKFEALNFIFHASFAIVNVNVIYLHYESY